MLQVEGGEANNLLHSKQITRKQIAGSENAIAAKKVL